MIATTVLPRLRLQESLRGKMSQLQKLKLLIKSLGKPKEAKIEFQQAMVREQPQKMYDAVSGTK